VFKKQIKDKGKIGITDMNMTRFFLTIEDAIKLVFKATSESRGGETFVMKMPACKIVDIARILAENANIKDIKFEILGVRPGEKIHELLLSSYESEHTISFDDRYFVILPTIHIEGLQEHYSAFKPANLDNYNSTQDLMSQSEIKEMLKKGGFI
jgi:FlaA1/EpsC-like NDP-sugar epimerase